MMEEFLEVAVLANLNGEELEDAILFNILNHGEGAVGNRADIYGRFNLNDIADEDCRLNFRFCKEDIPRLVHALGLPDVIRTLDGHTSTGIEGICILLRRLAYPNRWSDLEPMFGRSGKSLSNIGNLVIQMIDVNKGHILSNLHNLGWLNENRMSMYARAVTAKGSPIQNCWGFIDGTARAMCRPIQDQEEYYSGHKRYHALKYQSVVTPDGLIVNLQGPYPGRRHDAAILRESNFYEQLEERAVFNNQNCYVLYGDSAYGIRELIISPFPNTQRIQNYEERRAQQAFNYHMSAVTQCVEWGFGNIIRHFAFLDFKKNQKLLLQDLGMMYKVGALLTNCLTCLYGSETNIFFGIEPPTLEEYFGIQ